MKSWDLSEISRSFSTRSILETFWGVHSRFNATASKIYFAKLTHDFNERWYYLSVLTQVLKDDSFVSANCNAWGVWKPDRELFAAFTEPDCDGLSFCFEVAHAQGEVLFNFIQQGALFLFLIAVVFYHWASQPFQMACFNHRPVLGVDFNPGPGQGVSIKPWLNPRGLFLILD